ncbi:MAG TPA: hypothetical protein PK055_01140 [Gammaproteobacteria bacterium]|nr:hypothetical protein [Xanthomonadales bacterium]MCB1593581.1 hypothetical protein [Xanthomonadales bacterium]HOP21799.1 hypothetical protein [Gammaproteobacteria bacterium]HPI94974.1 hypothetical protein [Gammaproteobacteria bacterium]HPQ86240.1 hypothetical protein [Gammaproteobacteria bacterium]
MKQNKIKYIASVLTLFTINSNAIDINQQGGNIVLDEIGVGKLQLKIKSPDNQVKSFEVSQNYFELSPETLGYKSLLNGQYKYEVASIVDGGEITTGLRELNDSVLTKEYTDSVEKQKIYYSGTFTIANDILVSDFPENNEKGVANDTDGGTFAQVIANDLVVQGSNCVGLDCTTGESFGSDTIRLKENNLRIHFQDTSSTGAFPSNDWRIIANDSNNGGLNYLGIEDSNTGRMPFRVEAGADANNLYVEADGDVGIKTANPVVDLHIVEGNTPTLRLEQDGSDGFTPQIWDVAGNEVNFFVRDVTNGSKLSFRIEPNTPQDTLYLDSTGNVGIGKSNPDAKVHVLTNDDSGKLLFENTNSTQADRVVFHLKNNGKPQFKLENTGNSKSWIITAGNKLVIENSDGTRVMDLDEDGNLRISGNITTNQVF